MVLDLKLDLLIFDMVHHFFKAVSYETYPISISFLHAFECYFSIFLANELGH